MLKPDSFILQKTSIAIAILVQVFAVYLFFRGHNLPGGGFISAVASAIGVLLLVMANGKASASSIIRFDPLKLAAIGLLISTLTGIVSFAANLPFLAHFHYKNPDFPFFGSLYLGTPLLFDLGVFLTVFGVTCKVTLVLLDALDQAQSENEPAFSLNRSSTDTPIANQTTGKEMD